MPKEKIDPAKEEKYDPSKTGVGFVVSNLAGRIVQNMRDMRENAYTKGDEFYDANREAVENFAKMVKYYEYGMIMQKQGKNVFTAKIPEDQKKKLDQEAEELSRSPEVYSIIYQGNEDYVVEALTRNDELLGERPRSMGDFVAMEEADGTIRFGSNDQLKEEERRRAGLLTGFLDQTTSKSFTGKLKSWFVGNSTEYKNAIASLKDFASGRGNKETAIEKIKAYLDIRKSKVRDHQYGRDRFQGFMESLQTLMDPQDFQKYCDGVNKARKVMDKDYDPRHVQPEQFSPYSDKSVLSTLLPEDTKARKAEADRAAKEAEIREQEEKEAREEFRKKQEEYDRKVEEEIAREEQEKSGKTTPERDSKASQGPEPGM